MRRIARTTWHSSSCLTMVLQLPLLQLHLLINHIMVCNKLTATAGQAFDARSETGLTWCRSCPLKPFPAFRLFQVFESSGWSLPLCEWVWNNGWPKVNYNLEVIVLNELRPSVTELGYLVWEVLAKKILVKVAQIFCDLCSYFGTPQFLLKLMWVLFGQLTSGHSGDT